MLLIRISSAEPAVTVIPAIRTPVVPISFDCAEFGSNEEIPIVTEPIESEALIVCAVPAIGSEPDTVADVLTATTESVAIVPSRVELSDAMLPAIVNVFDVPAGIVVAAPTVA